MHKLFFWLNWRAGDLSLTRPLVRQVLDRHDVQIAFGCWQNQAYIVEDLPVRMCIDPRSDPPNNTTPESLVHLCPPGYLPIYLWVGKYVETLSHHWPAMVELYNRQVCEHGLPDLVIASRFVPMLDFPPVEVHLGKNAIFIENGVARSKHSDFEFDMVELSKVFPDFTFYCTSSPSIALPNVVDCSTFNLRVLSSISNRCLAILGKGSGPFCSTFTEANRYKPRAILRYHPISVAPRLWDYPGYPLQYLETHAEVIDFLRRVQDRPILQLIPNGDELPTNQSVIPLPIETEAAFIDHLLDQYSRNPDDNEYRAEVGKAKERVITFWNRQRFEELEQNYRGAWGRLVARLMKLGPSVLDQLPTPLNSTKPESIEKELARSMLSDSAVIASTKIPSDSAANFYSSATLSLLIQALMSLPPWRLPKGVDLRQVPAWLRADLLDYILQPVDFAETNGAVDDLFAVRSDLLKSLRSCLLEEEPSPYHKHLGMQLIKAPAEVVPLNSDQPSFESRRAMGDILSHAFRAWNFPIDHPGLPRPANIRPRVGFLIPAIYSSGVTYRTLPWIDALAKEFELYLYLGNQTQDRLEAYALSKAHQAILLSARVEDSVPTVRNDNLDILIFATDIAIDLGSMRLAPHQIMINNFTTTGLNCIDGIVFGANTLGDPVQPESTSESLHLLPGSGINYFVAQQLPMPSNRLERPALQIHSNQVILSSLANVAEITSELLDCWITILKQVPNASLLLAPFDPARSNRYRYQDFYDWVVSRFQRQGLDASRLRVINPQPFPIFEHWSSYFGLADVYLDSFPVAFPDGVFASLKANIPVVTRRGPQTRSNTSAALIQDLGPAAAESMIAANTTEYIERAVALGQSPQLRQQVSGEIRQRFSKALFLDSNQFNQQVKLLVTQILRTPPFTGKE
jgi:predicted O-linked N-acetylglucosamine transferase (SPINDLY family)